MENKWQEIETSLSVVYNSQYGCWIDVALILGMFKCSDGKLHELIFLENENSIKFKMESTFPPRKRLLKKLFR